MRPCPPAPLLRLLLLLRWRERLLLLLLMHGHSLNVRHRVLHVVLAGRPLAPVPLAGRVRIHS